jgi:hypothetical protein
MKAPRHARTLAVTALALGLFATDATAQKYTINSKKAANRGPWAARTSTNPRAVVLGGNQVRFIDMRTLPPTILKSHNILGGAHDLAITPDGSKVVVRGANQVHFFYMRNGNRTGPAVAIAGPGAGSDWVAATNTRAIALGANQVRIIDIDAVPPVVLQSHALGAGGSHDIALTPDGTKAVVRSGTRIQYFRLGNGNQLGTGDAIAGAGGGSDWVAASNQRAIALGGTQARIIDLTTNPPTIIASHALVGGSDHDVVLTPDRRMAVTRSAHLIQYFDLITGAQVGTGDAIAGGGTAADWIAATATRAIALGANQVRIVDLTPPIPVVIASHALAGPGHDLDLTPDGSLAVVRGANLVHTFELATGAQRGFGIALAGPGGPADSDFVDVPTNTRAVAIGANQIRILDLEANPPVVIAGHALVGGGLDLAVTRRRPIAVVRSATAIQFFDVRNGTNYGTEAIAGAEGIGDADWAGVR